MCAAATNPPGRTVHMSSTYSPPVEAAVSKNVSSSPVTVLKSVSPGSIILGSLRQRGLERPVPRNPCCRAQGAECVRFSELLRQGAPNRAERVATITPPRTGVVPRAPHARPASGLRARLRPGFRSGLARPIADPPQPHCVLAVGAAFREREQPRREIRLVEDRRPRAERGRGDRQDHLVDA